MQKNSDGLFDVFQSTGSNAKELINRSYSASGGVTKEDLLDINVQALPATIALAGNKPDQKLAYFVDTGNSYPVTFTLDTAYDSISLEYK